MIICKKKINQEEFTLYLNRFGRGKRNEEFFIWL